MADISELLSRLEKVQGKHPHWRSLCPAHHNRKSRTLSITETSTGLILVHCFAGCGGADIMDAIGMSLSDLYPEESGPAIWKREKERKRRDERECKSFQNECLMAEKIKELEDILAGVVRV